MGAVGAIKLSTVSERGGTTQKVRFELAAALGGSILLSGHDSRHQQAAEFTSISSIAIGRYGERLCPWIAISLPHETSQAIVDRFGWVTISALEGFEDGSKGPRMGRGVRLFDLSDIRVIRSPTYLPSV